MSSTTMFRLILIILWGLQKFAVALQVTPGSPCAALCLNDPKSDTQDPGSSFTNAADISCTDHDYQSSSKGIKFKNCMECLQNSNAVSGDENDMNWFLYNLRYSVDVCVYGFPNITKAVSSPCDIDYACQPLKKALEDDELNPDIAAEYGYCDADGGKFAGSQVDSCIQCFQSSTNQAYLANFFTALKAGCQQRPQSGALIGLSGSLFTKLHVNITAPPRNDTSAVDTGTGATAMTTGAIVGIAVGAGLLFLGGTALFWVYYRKQKDTYTDFSSEYDARSGSKSISPPLQGAFSAMDTEQQLSDYELKSQQAYVNNADYYDKYEKELQGRRPIYAFNPNKPGSGPSGALPTHHAYLPQTMSRNSDKTRGSTPDPNPRPVKSNKPDSYALQAYLNAAEDAKASVLPGPPPGPLPAAHARGNSLNRGSLPHSSHNRSSSRLSNGSSSDKPAQLRPAPLPRQAASKIPALQLPSVPRIRIPKKYPPPKINIEGATPVADKGDMPVRLEISNPIISHEERFAERRPRTASPQRIVEQKVVDRRAPRYIEEVSTGKREFMFG
ncbi:uncharacterized protein BCR38DRAFT_417055 [Pseudomassariella vexata]|uniref:LPXTG-domain-containing protein n=1 Tax=Pseudomassariella vexata TaxID=1141098 RepID=A0A1Y2EIU5_9PEZI|nr:uncharacterized protein BCR38DRAFT_417055 [Pseudomassariella vexata]ORY71512.1 hypothetical protein BCR38DRAFT_417055 [Pseudomassariella vexata]